MPISKLLLHARVANLETKSLSKVKGRRYAVRGRLPLFLKADGHSVRASKDGLRLGEDLGKDRARVSYSELSYTAHEYVQIRRELTGLFTYQTEVVCKNHTRMRVGMF